MSTPARETEAPTTAPFEFEAFKSLPCGCVAVMQRTLDPGLFVVSLEAKGTYCELMEHVLGRAAAVPSAVTDEVTWTDLRED